MESEITLQIQSVLYENDTEALLRALDALHNALLVHQKGVAAPSIKRAVVKYGDASSEKLFSQGLVDSLNEQYGDVLSVEYVFFGENTGTAKGHNRLIRDSQSTYIMVMNPDVLVCPTFFDTIFLPFEEEGDDVGLVEGRQTPIEHPKSYDQRTGETSWASTAAVVFPKEAYDLVGGFDEDTFFMYCDDVDFSWMIRLAGKRVIYQPESVVFHAKRLSEKAGWVPTFAEVYYSAEAALLMSYKWSNDTRLKKLLDSYASSGLEACEKAVEEFRKREAAGRLPERLDGDHEVATFVDDGYAVHKFNM